MNPLLRIWAISAACLALLFLLRGAWAAALACFFLSPAPVLLFAHGRPEQRRLSVSWLGAIAIGFAVVVALFAVVVSMGGVPPVHQWRSVAAGVGY